MLAICKDPTSERVLLVVTQYQDHSGGYLCVPVVFKGGRPQDALVQFSAMRFVDESLLHKNHAGFASLPANAIWDIEEYILENKELFKDKIQGWQDAFSPVKGQYNN